MDIKDCISDLKNDIDLKFEKINSLIDENFEFKKILFDEKCFEKIDKIKHVIYYIEIISNWKKDTNDKFLVDFEKLKTSSETKKLKIKFPQINSEFSTILYVGKSTTDFKNRIKYHCKLNSPSTYAIHYEYWKNFEKFNNIQLQLNYHQFEEAKFDLYDYELQKELIEIIESSLHKKLKPILGRAGH